MKEKHINRAFLLILAVGMAGAPAKAAPFGIWATLGDNSGVSRTVGESVTLPDGSYCALANKQEPIYYGEAEGFEALCLKADGTKRWETRISLPPGQSWYGDQNGVAYMPAEHTPRRMIYQPFSKEIVIASGNSIIRLNTFGKINRIDKTPLNWVTAIFPSPNDGSVLIFGESKVRLPANPTGTNIGNAGTIVKLDERNRIIFGKVYDQDFSKIIALGSPELVAHPMDFQFVAEDPNSRTFYLYGREVTLFDGHNWTGIIAQVDSSGCVLKSVVPPALRIDLNGDKFWRVAGLALSADKTVSLLESRDVYSHELVAQDLRLERYGSDLKPIGSPVTLVARNGSLRISEYFSALPEGGHVLVERNPSTFNSFIVSWLDPAGKMIRTVTIGSSINLHGITSDLKGRLFIAFEPYSCGTQADPFCFSARDLTALSSGGLTQVIAKFDPSGTPITGKVIFDTSFNFLFCEKASDPTQPSLLSMTIINDRIVANRDSSKTMWGFDIPAVTLKNEPDSNGLLTDFHTDFRRMIPIGKADLLGDGKGEGLVLFDSSNRHVVYRNSLFGTLQAPVELIDSSGSPVAQSPEWAHPLGLVHDLDGPGSQGVLWYNANTLEIGFWTLKGLKMTGGTIIRQSNGAPISQSLDGMHFVGQGDLEQEGNGNQELVFYSDKTHYLGYWKVNSKGGFIDSKYITGSKGKPVAQVSTARPIGLWTMSGDSQPGILFVDSENGNVGYWALSGGNSAQRGVLLKSYSSRVTSPIELYDLYRGPFMPYLRF